MADGVADELHAQLADIDHVDEDVLWEARFYFEASRGRSPGAMLVGIDMDRRLADESFSPAAVQRLRGRIVEVATETRSVSVRRAAVAALHPVLDVDLVPLLTEWLDIHLAELLAHNRVVSELLTALIDSGAPVCVGSSHGIDMIENSVASARRYLEASAGIVHPM